MELELDGLFDRFSQRLKRAGGGLRRAGRWVCRVAARLALAILILCVLLAIPWTYFYIRWGRQLESEMSKLRAAKAPLTLKEAAPQPIPDDQNAAILYEKAFGAPPVAEPSFAGPRTLGLSSDEYMLVSDFVNPGNVAKRPQMQADVRRALERPEVMQALDLIRTASQMPRCVFPRNWDQGIMGLAFREFGGFKSIVRLIQAQAILAAARGDANAALGWLAVGLRMTRHVASESILFSQSECYAMQAPLLASLEQILSTSAPSPMAMAGLEDYLRDLDLRSFFVKSLPTERASDLTSFDMAPLDPDLRKQLLFSPLRGDKRLRDRVLLRVYFSALGAPLRRGDRLCYLRHANQIIAIAPLPYPTAQSRSDLLKRETEAPPRSS